MCYFHGNWRFRIYFSLKTSIFSYMVCFFHGNQGFSFLALKFIFLKVWHVLFSRESEIQNLFFVEDFNFFLCGVFFTRESRIQLFSFKIYIFETMTCVIFTWGRRGKGKLVEGMEGKRDLTDGEAEIDYHFPSPLSNI